MKLVLIEPDLLARPALEALLRRLGARVVLTFAHAEIAFCFLLGRLHEVDGVVVNEDGEAASRFLRRFGAVPASPPAATYSGRSLARAARLVLRSRSQA